MSDPHVVSAIVLQDGEWSTESQKYPAFRFIETCRREQFDVRDHGRLEEFYTDDFSVSCPHAEHHTGGREAAFHSAANKFFTDPYSDHRNDPYHAVAIETKDGYEAYVQCYLFAKIKGNPVATEELVTDAEGKKWDAKVPVFYHFELIKDKDAKHGGLKMKHVTLIKDTGAVNDVLRKRGRRR